MSEIDWSKAPEWADKYGIAGICSMQVWFNKDQYVYVDDANQKPLRFGDTEAFARDRNQFVVIAARPSPAWSGEGLPPVGFECEYQDSFDDWQRVEITGHSKLGVCFVVDGCSGENYVKKESKFRPIRTPEQIAKDERTKACDRMFGVILDKLPQGQRTNGSDICEALYDAGYRKVEQPE